jgi:hypothetical protein
LVCGRSPVRWWAAGSAATSVAYTCPEPGEDPRALVRPAMTLARAELRTRLAPLVVRARRRWLHPTSVRRPGEPFL